MEYKNGLFHIKSLPVALVCVAQSRLAQGYWTSLIFKRYLVFVLASPQIAWLWFLWFFSVTPDSYWVNNLKHAAYSTCHFNKCYITLAMERTSLMNNSFGIIITSHCFFQKVASFQYTCWKVWATQLLRQPNKTQHTYLNHKTNWILTTVGHKSAESCFRLL
jgi:hypothetical protein